ncbi:MAG: hypothetical protein Q7S00_07055, partial [bacterium]|nr:hypothetical protein [bacterium]
MAPPTLYTLLATVLVGQVPPGNDDPPPENPHAEGPACVEPGDEYVPLEKIPEGPRDWIPDDLQELYKLLEGPSRHNLEVIYGRSMRRRLVQELEELGGSYDPATVSSADITNAEKRRLFLFALSQQVAHEVAWVKAMSQAPQSQGVDLEAQEKERGYLAEVKRVMAVLDGAVDSEMLTQQEVDEHVLKPDKRKRFNEELPVVEKLYREFQFSVGAFVFYPGQGVFRVEGLEGGGSTPRYRLKALDGSFSISENLHRMRENGLRPFIRADQVEPILDRLMDQHTLPNPLPSWNQFFRLIQERLRTSRSLEEIADLVRDLHVYSIMKTSAGQTISPQARDILDKAKDWLVRELSQVLGVNPKAVGREVDYRLVNRQRGNLFGGSSGGSPGGASGGPGPAPVSGGSGPTTQALPFEIGAGAGAALGISEGPQVFFLPATEPFSPIFPGGDAF